MSSERTVKSNSRICIRKEWAKQGSFRGFRPPWEGRPNSDIRLLTLCVPKMGMRELLRSLMIITRCIVNGCRLPGRGSSSLNRPVLRRHPLDGPIINLGLDNFAAVRWTQSFEGSRFAIFLFCFISGSFKDFFIFFFPRRKVIFRFDSFIQRSVVRKRVDDEWFPKRKGISHSSILGTENPDSHFTRDKSPTNDDKSRQIAV